MIWNKLLCLVLITSCNAKSISNENNFEDGDNVQQVDYQDKPSQEVSYPNAQHLVDESIVEEFDQKDLADKLRRFFTSIWASDQRNPSYNGYEYIYHSGWMTYYEAENFCARHGGEVAYVNMRNPVERGFIYSMFGKKVNAWIGVRYFARKWRDPTFRPINNKIFGWNRGEPNSLANEQCTENWWYEKVVNNIACNARRPVICEIKIKKSSTANKQST